MERRCTHVLNEQSHSANFPIWGVTFWPTVERSRAYVLNVESYSVKLELWESTSWFTVEGSHTNVPNATSHSVMLAILGGTFWSTINRSRKHEIVDKPARLNIRLLFGFVSDLSSSTKMKTNTETAMLSMNLCRLYFCLYQIDQHCQYWQCWSIWKPEP